MAERLLIRTGASRAYERLHASRDLVLAYHNIVPDGEPIVGDRSLHLPRRRFAEQLDILLDRGVSVIPLREMIEGSPGVGGDGSRRVAITFDDGYRGAVETGVEELVCRNLPATIFVIAGLVDGRTFWWDALSAPEDGISDAVRREALNTAFGRTDEVLAWARRQGLKLWTVPEHARSAGEGSLQKVAGAGHGIEIASHTWSHPNLTRLDEKECQIEFVRASTWLEARFGVPDWLSYPYGLHDSISERAAATVGVRGAFRIEGGWLPPTPARRNEFRLPRLNIPAGLSREGFSLRLAGLFCR